MKERLIHQHFKDSVTTDLFSIPYNTNILHYNTHIFQCKHLYEYYLLTNASTKSMYCLLIRAYNFDIHISIFEIHLSSIYKERIFSNLKIVVLFANCFVPNNISSEAYSIRVDSYLLVVMRGTL